MPAFMRVIDGKGPKNRFAIPADRPVLLGRGEGCDLQIDDPSLSRIHCSLERQTDGWHLADCRSTNGTRVGGFRITETYLWHGDLVQIGDIRLEFSVIDSVVDPSSSEGAGVPHPLAGRRFGRFELLRLVSEGSRGVTYHAIEREVDRHVLLTLLNKDVVVEKIARKHQAVASLHPAFVQLHAAGKTDGKGWLSMEWVQGRTVQQLLDQSRRLSPSEAIVTTRQVAGAVQACTSRGVVLRNLDPSHIILDETGAPRIGDFVLSGGTASSSSAQHAILEANTPYFDYMAPECFEDPAKVDSRADVYSLGACLFAMLTGRSPAATARLARPESADPTVPAMPAGEPCRLVPKEIQRIIDRCLASDRTARFQSPQELFDAMAGLGDFAPTPVTVHEPLTSDTAMRTVIAGGDLDSLAADGPVSLPSSDSRSTTTWRRFLIIPKPTSAPARRPWSTLIGTIAAVVGIGSLLLFHARISNAWHGLVATNQVPDNPPLVVSSGTHRESNGDRPKRSEPKTSEAPVAPSRELAADLANPERLVVQPGTTVRNLSDAVDQAQDGQVVEVVSNDLVTAELKLPAKSLTLVANPEYHPVLRNTLRINGGGTIRLEGFHFEPYDPNKPAIDIEKMPDELEISGCTFRGIDGVLVSVRTAAANANKRGRLVVNRCFAAGDIIFAFTGLPPELRVSNSCFVFDQTAIDWQLSPGDFTAAHACDLAFDSNTFDGRSVFHVRLNDRTRVMGSLPRVTLALNANIFAFPTRFPGTFFRWESWQRPDIVRDRFVWSGTNNVFSGLGTWSMATTLALSDPAASPQVVIESPDDWQRDWADGVTSIRKLPPEFRYQGPAKKTAEIGPRDYEWNSPSATREGAADRSFGADVLAIPVPPRPR